MSTFRWDLYAAVDRAALWVRSTSCADEQEFLTALTELQCAADDLAEYLADEHA